MLSLLYSAIAILCCVCCIVVYRKIVALPPTVKQVENTVAQEMSVRAHSLCIQAYDAERLVNTLERRKAYDEFQDNLHLYLEDYQAEVAKRLTEYKVYSISAYGYIRIMK
jgi:hypothetical protein